MNTASVKYRTGLNIRFLPLLILCAILFLSFMPSSAAASLFENRTGGFWRSEAGFAGVEGGLNAGLHRVYRTFSYDFVPDSLDASKKSGDVADTGANTPWKLEKLSDGAGAGRYSRGVDVPKSGTEVVQRAMSRAELEYLQKHGTLRFGKVGTELDPHFVSDAVNTDLIRARLRLALPKIPELRVTLEVEKGVFGPSMKVKALDFGNGRILPGGGTERTATGVVRARVLNVEGF